MDIVTFCLIPQAVIHEHLEMKKLVLDHEKRQEEEESRGGCDLPSLRDMQKFVPVGLQLL